MHGEREPVGGGKGRGGGDGGKGVAAPEPGPRRRPDGLAARHVSCFTKAAGPVLSGLAPPTSQRLALGVQMRASTEKPGVGFWNWISL